MIRGRGPDAFARRSVNLGCAALCLLAVTMPAVAQPPDVAVSHRARGLFPGEAVLLRVEASGPLAEVRATAFDKTVRFYQATGGVWHGLVGIDLVVEPGDHDVALRILPVTGTAIARVYTLTVEHKEYQTRQLTVAPRYVEPPPEVSERIARESRQQSAIFATATEERLWRGSWGYPVPGRATSAFGSRSVFNGQPRNPHSGADFRAAEGTPVTAPNIGTVVLTGDTYFSGGSIILDHGWGLYSYFAHLSEILVEEGDLVEPGQVVGHAGSTGRVTGPHLHWTLRLNGARVDPVSLIEILEELEELGYRPDVPEHWQSESETRHRAAHLGAPGAPEARSQEAVRGFRLSLEPEPEPGRQLKPTQVHLDEVITDPHVHRAPHVADQQPEPDLFHRRESVQEREPVQDEGVDVETAVHAEGRRGLGTDRVPGEDDFFEWEPELDVLDRCDEVLSRIDQTWTDRH